MLLEINMAETSDAAPVADMIRIPPRGVVPLGYGANRLKRKTATRRKRGGISGFRYLNASTGRWLSRDPLEEQGGENLYGFCSGDPLSTVDRNGLDNFSTNGVGSTQQNSTTSVSAPYTGTYFDTGFKVVGSEIDEWYGKILQFVGIDHVDIAYNGQVIYVGRGGAEVRKGARYKVTNHTYALSKKTSGTMKIGKKANCLKCSEAKDSDILEALRSRKPSSGKNCQGDVQDAVDEVCLSGFKTIVGTFFAKK